METSDRVKKKGRRHGVFRYATYCNFCADMGHDHFLNLTCDMGGLSTLMAAKGSSHGRGITTGSSYQLRCYYYVLLALYDKAENHLYMRSLDTHHHHATVSATL